MASNRRDFLKRAALAGAGVAFDAAYVKQGYFVFESGLEAAREIRRIAPATKIIILTMHNSTQIADAVRDAGADALVVTLARSRPP